MLPSCRARISDRPIAGIGSMSRPFSMNSTAETRILIAALLVDTGGHGGDLFDFRDLGIRLPSASQSHRRPRRRPGGAG